MKRRLCALALLLLAAGCARTSAPAPTPTVPIPPPPPRGEPSEYIGMTAAKLRVALGTPQFLRQDGAGQMWRYDATGCKAFFFLYGAKGNEAVRHVETLPAGKTSAADPACLGTLKAGKKIS